MDLDATKIDLARGDADQAEVSNVEFRVANLADGLGEAEYDVVYARSYSPTWRPGRRRRADEGGPGPGGRIVGGGHRLRRLVLPPGVPGWFKRSNEIYARTAS